MSNNIFSFKSQKREENIYNFKKEFKFQGDIEAALSPEQRKKAETLQNALENKETLKNNISVSTLSKAEIVDAEISRLSKKIIRQEQKTTTLLKVVFKSMSSDGKVQSAIKEESLDSLFSEEKAPEFSFLQKGNIKRVAKNITRELDYADGIQDNNSYNAVSISIPEGEFSLQEFKIKSRAFNIEHDLMLEKFTQARNNLLVSGGGISEVQDIFESTIAEKVEFASRKYAANFTDFLMFGGNGVTGLVNDTDVTDLSADSTSLTFAQLQAGITGTTISEAVLNYVKGFVTKADSIEFNGLNRLKKVHITFPLKFKPLFTQTGLRFSDLLKGLEGATMIDAFYRAFSLAGYTPEDIEISFTNVFNSEDNINVVQTGLDVVHMFDPTDEYNMFYNSVVPFQLFSPFGGLNSPANTSNGYNYNYLMAGQFSGLLNLKPEKRYIIKN